MNFSLCSCDVFNFHNSIEFGRLNFQIKNYIKIVTQQKGVLAQVFAKWTVLALDELLLSMCRNSREIIFRIRFNCMAAFSYLLTILQNSFSPKSRDRWMILKKLFQQTLNRCFSYIRSTENFFFAKFGLWRSTVTLMPVGKHSSQSPFFREIVYVNPWVWLAAILVSWCEWN